jgi:tetratricopeptide (TPR) repeat protein
MSEAAPPQTPLPAVGPPLTVPTGAGEPLPLARGTTLGRYVVLEPIGLGGMGEVWSAYDPELDRKVALKLLRPGGGAASGGVAARDRLLREAQALARLAHPNVLTVFDVGTFGERVFIATELLAGKTLAAWGEEAPRGWRDVLAHFLAAGRGLAAAHRAGLVHRDFKPENVLVGDGGEVKVLDFGLARAMRLGEPAADQAKTIELPPIPAQRLLDSPLTVAGIVSGTLPYMPLEQLLGDAADARADQFSFCVALYEALYGERPFRGTTTDELVGAIVANAGVEPPATRGVPRFVRQALRRGLGRLPGDRFESMDQLLAALGRDPRRAWSRRLAAAAGALLLAAAAVVGGLAIRQRAQLCRGGERHLAGVWDEGQKEATRRAFLATKLPFADEAWRLAAAGLDGYAAAWTAMHRDACEATQLRGEQSAQVLDLRMSCLGTDLEHLRALTQAFAAADEQVVRRSAAAVEQLPLLEDCADMRTLTGVRQPSRQAWSKVEALRADLARASALYDLGRFPDALAIAQRVAAAARPLGYRPLQAEALLMQGEAQRRAAGDAAAAATLLAEAAWAGVASRHDRVALRASSTLVALLGGDQEDRAGAEPWIQMARAVLERHDSPPKWRAVLADELGRVAIATGDFDEAIRELQQALALRERSGAAPTLRADTMMLLGAAFLYSGRAAEGLPYLRQVYELRREALGELHPDLASAANNVGAAALVVGDYATAVEFIRRGLELKRRLLGPDHIELATSVNNLGEALRLGGRFDEAEPLYQEALMLQRRAYGDEHSNVALVLDGLGALENDRGRPAAALAYHRRAQTIRESRQGPADVRLAYPLTGEGKALLALGRAREALPLLERALVLRAKDADPVDVAETRFALARALVATRGEVARARDLAAAAATAYAQTGEGYPRQRAEIEAWLAAQGWAVAASVPPRG